MEFLLVSAQILLSNYFANAEIFRPLGEKLMPLHQTSIDKTFLFSGPRKYADGQLIKISAWFKIFHACIFQSSEKLLANILLRGN